MQEFPCFFCGTRPENEFTFGGEDQPPRPQYSLTSSASEWADHLYFRDNPRGPSRERWLHSGGCGQWMIFDRNTLTHAVSGVSLPAGGSEQEGLA